MDIFRWVRRLRGLLHLGLALYTALAVTVVVRTIDGLIDLQRGAWVAFDDGGFGFGDADVAALWDQWQWMWALVWVFWLVFLPALSVVVRAVGNGVGDGVGDGVGEDDSRPLSAFLSVLVPSVGVFFIDQHLWASARRLSQAGLTTASAERPSSAPSPMNSAAPKHGINACIAGVVGASICMVVAMGRGSQVGVLVALAVLLLPLTLVRVAQLWRWRSLLRDVQTRVDDDAVGHVGFSAPVGG